MKRTILWSLTLTFFIVLWLINDYFELLEALETHEERREMPEILLFRVQNRVKSEVPKPQEGSGAK